MARTHRPKNKQDKDNIDLDASKVTALKTSDSELEEKKDIFSTEKPKASTDQPTDHTRKKPPPLHFRRVSRLGDRSGRQTDGLAL